MRYSYCMLQIILHSSKTMRAGSQGEARHVRPRLQSEADELMRYLEKLSADQLGKSMHLSQKKANETVALLQQWSSDSAQTLPAIDAFLGDIYSGLQVQTFAEADRQYADTHLLILSGLYGGLRALDSIAPYRLEMGYRLPDEPYRNLYNFWDSKIAALLPEATSLVVNLSAVEYTKAFLPYVEKSVVTPKFLTISPKTGEPTFVVVHAKVARGAFARWLITQRVDNGACLQEFSELGYHYDATLSTPEQPTFVCEEFGGLGLSVRLT